jgi:hypothetical protein
MPRSTTAMLPRVLATSLLAAVGGCAQPTELVLVVDAEPRLTVGRVVVDVFGAGVGQRAETIVGTDGAPGLPLTLGVVPRRDGVSEVTFQVAATVREGEGPDTTLLRVARTRFLSGSSRMVRVVLSASCIGHACPDGETCDATGCVPIEVAPETLPGWSGSAPGRPTASECEGRSERCDGFDDDCDGMVDEGIELATSAENCGRCGVVCSGGSCADGLCLDEQVTHLAAGGAHACGIRRDGTVTCWGANHERQASAAAEAIVRRPSTRPGVGFVEVATGLDHTCVLTTDGRVACAGNGDTGALGTGTGDQSRFDTLVLTTAVVTAFDAGAGLTMATVGGRVVVWGSFGGMEITMPTEVPLSGTFTDVAAGTRHVCALLATGSVLCAGDNERGQLGQGDTMPRMVAAMVPGLDQVTELAAGRDVTCARRMDGTVWCWGANDLGQIGVAGTDQPAPVQVPMLGAARAIDVSRAGAHACAVLEDGTVACWGDNSTGALGDGTTMPRTGVVAVVGVRGAEEVACGGLDAGSGFTCARLTSGVVLCWGADELGQTGDGDPGPPTLVPHGTIGLAR